MLTHRKSLAVAVLVLTLCPVANAQTSKFEGVAAIAAPSINPPNPVEGCNRAKQDAEAKAVNGGTKGLVSWDRLSTDSDCSLTTSTAGSLGTYFIFTARGNFRK